MEQNLSQKYQVVAIYDDHIVVMESDAHFRDFEKNREIKISTNGTMLNNF